MRTILAVLVCLVAGCSSGDDEGGGPTQRERFQLDYERMVAELYPEGGASLCEQAEVMIEYFDAPYESRDTRSFLEQCEEHLTDDEARCITRTPDPLDVQCCYAESPIAPHPSSLAHCAPVAP